MTDRLHFDDSELDRRLFEKFAAEPFPDLTERLEAIRRNIELSDASRDEARGALGASAQQRSMFYRGRVRRWIGYEIVAVAIVMFIATWRFAQTDSLISNPETFTTYATKFGQRASIVLKDGTRVTLAPATSLQVQGRTIHLSGEALFTVVNHTAEPFIVRAAAGDSRVLGTTFSVRQYSNETSVRVAVAEGKVAVRNTVATNGDIAITTPGQPVYLYQNADRVARLLTFAQGALVIDAQPLGDIKADLERWFNIKLQIDPSVANRRLSTTLRSESVEVAFDIVAALTGTAVVRKNRTVIITQRGMRQTVKWR